MKRYFHLLLALAATTLTSIGHTRAATQFDTVLTDVHVHLTPDYSGGWQMGVYDFDNGVPYDPDTTLLYVSPTGRTTQPAGSQWNFIGAGAGNNYWRTPQNPAAGLISLSVATEETTPGTFTSYVETDPRVPAISQPWMKFSLSAVRGPGQFSLWQQSGTSLSAVWMSASQTGGLDATDLALVPEGGHVHYYSGFTAPGCYELDFVGSGRIGSSVSQSAVQTYHVAVAPPLVAASLSNSKLVDFIDPGLEHTLASTTSGLLAPFGAAYDAMCNVYATDVLRGRVVRYDLAGNATVFADPADGLTTPAGIALDAAGNAYVSNYLSNNIIKVNSAGVGTVFADAADGLASPFGLALDTLGNLYTADLNNSRVLKFDPAGNATVFADAADGLLSPISVGLDSLGNVYVADVLRSRVMKFNPAGAGSVFADAADGVVSPAGLAIDLFDNVFVSNYLTNSIVKVTPAGVGSSYATAADGLASPFGLAAFNPPLVAGAFASLGHAASVPEPSTAVLALLGAAGALLLRPRRRRCRPRIAPPAAIGPDNRALVSSRSVSLLGLVLVGLIQSPALADESSAKSAGRTRVAVVTFPGVELLDFAGPGEVFANARDGDQKPCFEVYTVGISKSPVKSTRFVTVTPQYDPTDAPAPDVLIVPGGGVESAMNNAPLCAWIDACRRQDCLLFSVCNGATVLGKLGCLDGRAAATHHDNIALLKLISPTTTSAADRKFVDHGPVLTAAGISSGIDAALYLVARLKGEETARRTASYIEYDHWYGFDSERPAADEQGVVSFPGRVYEPQAWQLTRLIDILTSQGVEPALTAYTDLMAAAVGTDQQMLSHDGLRMSADWLLKHGRDKTIGLSLLKFAVAKFPNAAKAHLDLGKALFESGDLAAAKSSAQRAAELEPGNKTAQELLKKCG